MDYVTASWNVRLDLEVRPGPVRTCRDCGIQWCSISYKGRPAHGKYRYCSICRPPANGSLPIIEKTCQQCGESYLPSSGHRGYKYCSVRCRKRSRGDLAQERACVRCGFLFTNAPKTWNKVCGRLVCELVFQGRPLFGTPAPAGRLYPVGRCEWCGESFRMTHPTRKWCDDGCRMRGAGYVVDASPIFVLNCHSCEELFVARSESSRYCSRVCGRWRLPDWKRRRIYERDALVCKICHLPTDPDDFEYVTGSNGVKAHRSGPNYPTLDHIVPRDLGGDDSMKNLRTAHKSCNEERGVAEGEQLAWAV